MAYNKSFSDISRSISHGECFCGTDSQNMDNNEGSPLLLELGNTSSTEEDCCPKITSNLNPNCNIFIPSFHQSRHKSNSSESLSHSAQIKGADILHDACTVNPLAEIFDPSSQCDNNPDITTVTAGNMDASSSNDEESIAILDTTPCIADLNTPNISFDSEYASNAFFDFPEDIFLPVIKKIVSHAHGFSSFKFCVNNRYYDLCAFILFTFYLLI